MKGAVHIVCKVQKMKKILQLKEQSCTGPRNIWNNNEGP